MVSKDMHNEQVPGEVAFWAFGTRVMVKAYADAAVRQRALAEMRMACRRYERLLSAFDPFSDVGRVNRASGRWVPVACETFDLLQASLGYCRMSQGRFDITAKPLVDLWDVHKGIVPTDEQIDQAMAHVDYRALKLQRRSGLLLARLEDPLAALDLGGTAKGWIADELCRLLEEYGVDSFIISLGGNVVARGCKPNGAPFMVGIRDPNNHERTLASLPLRDCSAVASGVTERFFEEDGCAYSHIIDLATGRPVRTDVRSVTLVGRRSSDCDGFSTTLCALGMRAGPAYVRELSCIDVAIFAGAQGEVVEVSSGAIRRIC